MPIEVSYPVYGVVSDAGAPQSTVTVYIKAVLAGATLDTLTDATGKYTIDLYDYANDGDTVNVWCFGSDGKYIGTSFVLDISNQAKRVNLALAMTTLADTITITDTKTLQFNKLCADTITVTDGLTKLYTTTFADTITVTDALAKHFIKTINETITVTDAITKNFNKIVSETITISDDLTKDFNKILSDTVTLSDALTKIYTTSFAETITITDDVIKTFNKLLSDTIALTDAVSCILSQAGSGFKGYSKNETKYLGYSKNEEKHLIKKRED